ncbi:MAG: hypothetical protein CL908_07985 [Deltaproteobacteria bacterium]|jgi:tRNA isopentenyl-2-thiomethyl-A-37 hydroxylase MiaE|nr:hypothetical protein [Deltaproteobacteria bacterium]
MTRNLAGRESGKQRSRWLLVDSGAVLHWASETTAAWLPRAKGPLEEVLLDRAHGEKKAAGAAIKRLFSVPHHRLLQEPLAELAGEEALIVARPCERARVHAG